jgi:hypothetical protein
MVEGLFGDDVFLTVFHNRSPRRGRNHCGCRPAPWGYPEGFPRRQRLRTI